MPPAISVVLPARNAAATLDRAVASIVDQTWQDWELVAVDDGSTDATAGILTRWRHSDSRVRVVPSAGRGLVAALQTGLQAAEGDLIARMDADDEALPTRLERQFAMLRQDQRLGVVSSRVLFGGDPHGQAGYLRHIDWLNTMIDPEQIRLNRFIESPLAHPSVMFRRDLVERLGGYRAGDFPEDYELWLRWLEAGVKMGKCAEPLLVWHDPPGRLSRTDPRYGPDAFYRLKAGYVARELLRLDPHQRRPRWIWGAGRPTRRRAEWLCSHGCPIRAYLDIDPRKIGGIVAGRPVHAPTDLPAPGEVIVLAYVGTLGARELIRAELARRGYTEGVDFLVCA